MMAIRAGTPPGRSTVWARMNAGSMGSSADIGGLRETRAWSVCASGLVGHKSPLSIHDKCQSVVGEVGQQPLDPGPQCPQCQGKAGSSQKQSQIVTADGPLGLGDHVKQQSLACGALEVRRGRRY